MTNGKSYTKKLTDGRTVSFTVSDRIGKAESTADEGCEKCGTDPEDHRKVEAAYTKNGTLVLRRLNYSQGRAESHTVFKNVAELVSNLDTSLSEEASLAEQLGPKVGVSTKPTAPESI